MSKRLFQVLDEMNVNDDVNKTATVGCCYDMVESKTAKGGGIVTIGVPAEAITRIFLGECQPFLILLDKKEYHRLESQPVAMTEAEQRAERYEKALKEIKKGLNWIENSRELDIIHEALTPKTTTDGSVNG